MTRFRFVVLLTAVAAVAALSPQSFPQSSSSTSEQDRAAVAKTGDAIRAGFAAGDVDAIMKYHHPDVEKWLSAKTHTVGRDALRIEIGESFKTVRLVFEDNRVESTLFVGDTAVEVSSFTIRVTPKDGGAPSSFKGRAMVVYIRSSQSPTGWLSMRELIQPVE
jgi:ketosteroid isomerase-like protein